MSSAYGRPKPIGGMDLWSWYFMRVSGLALLLLALGHLVIMHLINSVDVIDYDFVARRYVGWFWRGYDLLLLVLAMIHGLNGMRVIVDDYLHQPAQRRVAAWLLHGLGTILIVLGVVAVVTFRPPVTPVGVGQ
ncbi:MAG: succinate dehydrogenase [Candidatus Omnitrophica bacterium]|nr:succinate dehydrogenase [Candidatus Omnitrophota bacterium]